MNTYFFFINFILEFQKVQRTNINTDMIMIILKKAEHFVNIKIIQSMELQLDVG